MLFTGDSWWKPSITLPLKINASPAPGNFHVSRFPKSYRNWGGARHHEIFMSWRRSKFYFRNFKHVSHHFLHFSRHLFKRGVNQRFRRGGHEGRWCFGGYRYNGFYPKFGVVRGPG